MRLALAGGDEAQERVLVESECANVVIDGTIAPPLQ